MKKDTNIITWTIVGFIIIFVIWIFVFCLPNWTLFLEKKILNGEGTQITEHLSIVYVAVGVLFTALAFGGTLLNIFIQHKNRLRETAADVFMKVFDTIQKDTRFNDAIKYLNNSFSTDLEAIKKKLQKDFGTDEFKKIKKRRSKKIGEDSNEKTEIIATSYDYIMYVCYTMEYWGTLMKHEFINEIIFDYAAGSIINSYEKLCEVLEFDKTLLKEEDKDSYFIHYRRLYDKAKKYRTKFIEECRDYLSNSK